MEVETHKVASPDIVVPTLDTVRHEALLYTWLADHKPMGQLLLLCLFHHDDIQLPYKATVFWLSKHFFTPCLVPVKCLA